MMRGAPSDFDQVVLEHTSSTSRIAASDICVVIELYLHSDALSPDLILLVPEFSFLDPLNI